MPSPAATPAVAPAPPPAPPAHPSPLGLGGVGGLRIDTVMRFVTAGAAVFVLVMLGSLVFILAKASWPAMKEFGFGFLVDSSWQYEIRSEETGEILKPARFGALSVIYGTAVSSAIALLVAVPFSFGAALFLVRISWKWLAGPASFLIEFLAAIPSIAYGIWGLFVLTPFLQGNLTVPAWLTWTESVPVINWTVEQRPNFDTPDPNDKVLKFIGLEPLIQRAFTDSAGKPYPGFNWLFQQQVQVGQATITRPISLTGKDMLHGGLILAIMIIPIITAISRDVLKQVPRLQIEGTLALGATWWQSSKEMLRYSRSALFGAVMLGLARAAGETMAVTLVIGNVVQVQPSPFAPAQTMSSLLASEFAETTGAMHRSALTEVALVLLVMSLVFNVVARYLVVGGGSRTAAAH
jgi:phosphate transport system permease protein